MGVVMACTREKVESMLTYAGSRRSEGFMQEGDLRQHEERGPEKERLITPRC
jgi:hypothetical protein